MHFEHLVEINDFRIPLLFRLDRAQVWAGLMHRVEDARPFLPGLDECRIMARGEGTLERVLRFGATEVRDRVSYAVGDWVRFETTPSEHHGGGVLIISIEEPETDSLFLRFRYETLFASGHEAEDAAYGEFLRQAYEAADIDTVQVIRMLAETADRPARH
ncbi:hypothetical protein B9N43_05380 [Denitratisoma sp. DHT3]|uniref:SRPBCC family protein n=1 Tax=Denitratisoma sp. DHT3 TaxID=1981880 RepID=UPI00119865A5|nr:SRPBCC family protein [Denitratisoma sp. DHT3]QDX80726.1 hypothetical protein B9N43_05380 [Denitratisoma sp. DHT3]